MILDLQEQILKRLPRNARAGTARLLSRYYAALFADDVKIYLKDADLPDECLYRLYSEEGDKDRVIFARAGAGDLRHLKWLRVQNRRRVWHDDTCAMAAKGGHLDVLKWLLRWQCSVNEYTCSQAAYGGHIHVLEWLREQQCPWDEETCSMAAAFGGHLEVVKWLRAQDPPCSWDGITCTRAACFGNIHVLKWVLTQDPPCPYTRDDAEYDEGDGAFDNLSAEDIAWIWAHVN